MLAPATVASLGAFPDGAASVAALRDLGIHASEAWILRSRPDGVPPAPGLGPWCAAALDRGPGGELRSPALRVSHPAHAGAVHENLEGTWVIGPGRAGDRRWLLWRDARPALYVIADARLPDTTRAALARGAADHGVPFREIDPGNLDPWAPPLPPGSALYNPLASDRGMDAEEQLWQPGVGSFWEDGPYIQRSQSLRALARGGVTVPRSAAVSAAHAPQLGTIVEALGGFPVVVKFGGGEGGIGTLRADSMPALRSLLDLAWSRGETPRLVAWIPDAVHWRVIVLDGAALTAYRNPVRREDFRSAPSSDPDDYGLVPPPEVAALAVRAAAVQRVGFGGADVLVHPSGRAYLLELNFPCYFPSAESFDRADVAGPMVGSLLRRASAG